MHIRIFVIFMQGLINICKHVQGEYILQPFLPGNYEEYELLNDGRTRLLQTVNYHKPGDKPNFQVYTPWNSMLDMKI